MHAMRITIAAEVDDPADMDETDGTGLTESAYNRLVDALASVGLSIVFIERTP